MNKKLFERYKNQSPIVGTWTSPLNAPQISGASAQINNQLKEVRESLEDLQHLFSQLGDEFEGYKLEERNRGNKLPTEWPPDLIAKRDDLEARIAVKTLEVKHLAKLLDDAIETENATAPDRGKCLPSDRRMWKVGRGGPDGVLRELGGQKLGLKEDSRGDEILHILDERSPYNGLPVWEFKVKVLKAMDHRV
jgi:hypothetical protein